MWLKFFIRTQKTQKAPINAEFQPHSSHRYIANLVKVSGLSESAMCTYAIEKNGPSIRKTIVSMWLGV
jgi:hypothetical protein